MPLQSSRISFRWLQSEYLPVPPALQSPLFPQQIIFTTLPSVLAIVQHEARMAQFNPGTPTRTDTL